MSQCAVINFSPSDTAGSSSFDGLWYECLTDVANKEQMACVVRDTMISSMDHNDAYILRTSSGMILSWILTDPKDPTGPSVAEETNTPFLPPEVRAFCDEKHLEKELRTALSLARGHFEMSKEPSFEVVFDPEHGEHYLGVHIWANGEPDDVFQRGRTFSRAFRTTINRHKANFINVIYHAI